MFDPSLTATGVWIDNESRSVVIRTGKDKSRIERLAQIHERVTCLLSETRPALVVCEGYAFGVQNSKSMTVQAEVGGIIRSLASVLGAQVFEVAPIQWKSAVMGKDMIRAKKGTKLERMLYLGFVKALSNIEFETCDEADAWMIGAYIKRVLENKVRRTDAALRLYKELSVLAV